MTCSNWPRWRRKSISPRFLNGCLHIYHSSSTDSWLIVVVSWCNTLLCSSTCNITNTLRSCFVSSICSSDLGKVDWCCRISEAIKAVSVMAFSFKSMRDGVIRRQSWENMLFGSPNFGTVENIFNATALTQGRDGHVGFLSATSYIPLKLMLHFLTGYHMCTRMCRNVSGVEKLNNGLSWICTKTGPTFFIASDKVDDSGGRDDIIVDNIAHHSGMLRI